MLGVNIPGETFTDVTPWASNTGPNLDGADYTATVLAPPPSWFSCQSLFRLPAANNEAVAICKLLKEQSTGDTADYANTIFSATNIRLGAAPTFNHHSAFATGYMSTAWTVLGSIPTTGYAVVDYREITTLEEQDEYWYLLKDHMGLDTESDTSVHQRLHSPARLDQGSFIQKCED